MFCPEKYLPFSFVTERAKLIADEYLEEILLPQVDRNAASGGDHKREYRLAYAKSTLLQNWLIDDVLFFQPVPIYAYYADGRLLRVSRQVFFSNNNISRYRFEDHYEDELETYTHSLYGWSISPQYGFIDTDVWQIVAGDEPQFSDRVANLSFTADFLREKIRPFQGGFLCLSASDADACFQHMQTAHKDDDTRDDKKHASSDNIVRCLLEAFPDGKASETWENVERVVGYSRRSIIRALDSREMRWWASGGGQPQGK
ncbi:hypothetical protein KBY27_20260 [Ruegeria pomeroyi]|uniref:Uncharacterized protein n=1 Tax=Ruegeria pomeroyi TaxID=89184 RepID=A0A9Q3WR46_9RHOB|nr:hypothetical protein [Ruegeria pomeroyi]MCE8539802.1 hypothetical protein [Ruegeria pomeroyi]